jgi:mono/diheme cytochrome c family protein
MSRVIAVSVAVQLLLLSLATHGLARADGVFTAAQADAGASHFAAECQRCHGSKLQGGFEEPPLRGTRFLSKWEEQTPADLLSFIAARMPPQRPGFLGESQNLDIVAFILRSNGALDGSTPLTKDVTTKIGALLPGASATPPSPAKPNP